MVSKQGMYYDREGEHHFFFRFHYLKTFDKGSATTTPSDEFIKKKMQTGKVIKTGNCRSAHCVLRAEKTLVVNNFPSNIPISYGV